VKVAGEMVGQLFLRSYERSDRIYQAMLGRGYSGQIRTLHMHSMKQKDWLVLMLATAILLGLQLVGRMAR
jgi:cobalt/nickel transport system permease protein